MCTTVRYRIGLIDGLALFLPCWHLTNLVCLLRAIQHIAYTMEKCLLICNDSAIQGMTTYKIIFAIYRMRATIIAAHTYKPPPAFF